MENQDKIYEQFKDAAGKAEGKSFDRMEAVWNRVEEKLDNKKQRRVAAWYKYAGIAAMFLLFMGIGTFLLNNEKNPVVAPKITPENKVTVIDTQKVEEIFNQPTQGFTEGVVVNEAEPTERKTTGAGDKPSDTREPALSSVAEGIAKEQATTVKAKPDAVVAVTEVKDTAKAKVSGIITDAQGMPIPGVNLIVDGTAKQTQTDFDGKYMIDAKEGEKIIATYVGMESQAITLGRQRNNIDLTLQDGSARLEEVVVEGYRTTTRATSNVAVATITSKSIQGRPHANYIQSVQGQVQGLKIDAGAEMKDTRQKPLSFAKVKTPLPVDVDQEDYESFVENEFENPAIAPLSTFSIDVDNASYTNIRRFINNGQPVPKDAVRVEEMINFFKYQYPQPKSNDPFSINTEYSDAPWNPKHKLLRIGLQGKIIADDNLPASNFVFLIDVSGSMNEQNKLPLLKESMKLLVNQMRKKDRLAIVVYAGAAGLVLPSTSGAEKDKIIAALDDLSAGGSTAGGAGIELAYKTALENFIKNGNNRVILATDGDFNIGASSDADMQTLIEDKRKSGVFLTCLGYGMGNYKDSKMEILADKGNGNYAYIDTMQEADRYLNKEFKGSMYAIAKDVKIQIEFNPKHVQSYRLIGYENRKLRDEDFINDAIDAGELGSGHTVTALYEIIPAGTESEYFTPAPQLKYSKPKGTASEYSDELATIKFRSKKPDEDKSTEVVKTIPNTVVPLQNASGDFKFSAAVAWFGLKLRDSKLIPNKASDDIKALARQGLQNDPEGYRAEFIRLVDMVK